MHIAVTGSIATDHPTVFPGRFADQLIPGQLDHISLSFLADTLEVRRGGVAANIAVGLARLGLSPLLVGAAGKDFDDYDVWLQKSGVDSRAVRISDTLHTARFMCTTDADNNQIATFYAGAMTEARHITIASLNEYAGPPELVVIAPNDPEAMLRHTAECREIGLPFAADPSQQLARLDREETRSLVEGAEFLFTNEYEAALLRERTGWTDSQVFARCGTWVTTRGAGGVAVLRENRPELLVGAVPTASPAPDQRHLRSVRDIRGRADSDRSVTAAPAEPGRVAEWSESSQHQALPRWPRPRRSEHRFDVGVEWSRTAARQAEATPSATGRLGP
ncbi:PfkB family carbohydrate kinase [Streptomyces sanglieri]|uniref:PfkB family carbohydrate kinase n=1 Tax=Streptomyces sanglieri TaxID=193460 RepID=UPI003524162B